MLQWAMQLRALPTKYAKLAVRKFYDSWRKYSGTGNEVAQLVEASRGFDSRWGQYNFH